MEGAAGQPRSLTGNRLHHNARANPLFPEPAP
jgi:hypothetical protein